MKKRFLEELQKLTSPVAWNKGLELSRKGKIHWEGDFFEGLDFEVRFKVFDTKSLQWESITLWPEGEDGCDLCCSCSQDFCFHGVAAAIFWASPSPNGSSTSLPQIFYSLEEKKDGFELLRFLEGSKEPLMPGTLLASAMMILPRDWAMEKLLLQHGHTPSEDFLWKAWPFLREDPQKVFYHGRPMPMGDDLQTPLYLWDEKKDLIGCGFGGEQAQSWKKFTRDEETQIYHRRMPPPPSLEGLLADTPTFWPKKSWSQLVSYFLPLWQQQNISVISKSQQLPQGISMEFHLEAVVIPMDGILKITVYGAYGCHRLGKNKELLDKNFHPIIRDLPREALEIKKLKEWKLELEKEKAFSWQDGEALWEKMMAAGVWGEALEKKPRLIPHVEFLEDGGKRLAFSIHGKEVDVSWKDLWSSYEDGERSFWLPEVQAPVELPWDWLDQHGVFWDDLYVFRKEKKSQISQKASMEIDLHSLPSWSQREVIPLPPRPSALEKALRAYQKEGVTWLENRWYGGWGLCLADEMGLGKTLQTLAVLKLPALIVAPTSLLGVWQWEVSQWRDDWISQGKVHLYHGPNGTFPKNPGLVITSYGKVRQGDPKLMDTSWHDLILDEAQYIKNPQAQVTKAVGQLKKKRALALSGTPMENHITDLWSLFQVIMPGYLGKLEWFLESSPQKVKKKMAPLILRRLKKDVAKDLPPKTVSLVSCLFSEEERALYHALRSQALGELRQGKMPVFSLLLRLRQACCHPGLIPQIPWSMHQGLSTKLKTLMDMLSVLESRASCLIFSQWTSLLDLTAQALSLREQNILRLDGRLSSQERSKVVHDFQNGPPGQILLMSLKAGGVGLTLTAAEHVFFLDPWWNPAAEQQAMDRVHRIGQERPVFVHKLVVQNTLETRILSMQKSKTLLTEHFLTHEETPLSKEFWREILEESKDDV